MNGRSSSLSGTDGACRDGARSGIWGKRRPRFGHNGGSTCRSCHRKLRIGALHGSSPHPRISAMVWCWQRPVLGLSVVSSSGSLSEIARCAGSLCSCIFLHILAQENTVLFLHHFQDSCVPNNSLFFSVFFDGMNKMPRLPNLST